MTRTGKLELRVAAGSGGAALARPCTTSRALAEACLGGAVLVYEQIKYAALLT